MPHELETDIDVAAKLDAAGIPYKAHESSIVEINQALKTASKKGTKTQGYPEYVGQSGNYILVVEDKRESDKQAKYVDSSGDSLLMDKTSIMNYAENGAVHYATAIVNLTDSYKEAIAVGITGWKDGKDVKTAMRVYYVSDENYNVPKLVDGYVDFSFLTGKDLDDLCLTEKIICLQYTLENFKVTKEQIMILIESIGE